MSRRQRPRKTSIVGRLLCVIGLLFVVGMLVLGYRRATLPIREHHQIGEMIASLATRRPEEMTREQWQAVYFWTVNLHVHSSMHYANGDDRRRFQSELHKKLNRRVDMDTIIWIWDEYAHLTDAGKNYQINRQIMLDEVDGKGLIIYDATTR